MRQVLAKTMSANRGRSSVKQKEMFSVQKKLQPKKRMMMLVRIAPKWTQLISACNKSRRLSEGLNPMRLTIDVMPESAKLWKISAGLCRTRKIRKSIKRWS